MKTCSVHDTRGACRTAKNTAVLDAREKKILTRHLLRRHRCLLHR